MTTFLLDTHVWVWALTGDRRLSDRAIASMGMAEHVLISPISLFEVGQKVRIGKWPEMEPFASRLPELIQMQGGQIATVTPEICLNASMLNWDHRDPLDRLLAATAIERQVALISADTVFDTLSSQHGWVARIW